MKYAIISVTEKGHNLAKTILSYLEDDPSVIKADIFNKNVKSTLNEHFHDYDCWVGVMDVSYTHLDVYKRQILTHLLT